MPFQTPHIPYEDMTDEALVKSSLQYEEAFYYLIKRYEPVLLRYIHRMTQAGREEAEDLLQDVYIKVYRNLNGFDTGMKFSAWVYRITHNEIISQYRKKRRDRFHVELDADNPDARALKHFLIDTLNVESDFLNNEKAAAVRSALNDLSPEYRDVLLLRFFEGLNYEEIGDVLCKPPGTVATLINRAKTKFKKIAERHHLGSI
jgi:RNA polymerase sigma-70 factor, ECF subfamily